MVATMVFAGGCAGRVGVEQVRREVLLKAGLDPGKVDRAALDMADEFAGLEPLALEDQRALVVLIPIRSETGRTVDVDMVTLKLRDLLNEYAGSSAIFAASDRAQPGQAQAVAPGASQVRRANFFLFGVLTGGDDRGRLGISFELVDALSTDLIWEGAYEVGEGEGEGEDCP